MFDFHQHYVFFWCFGVSNQKNTLQGKKKDLMAASKFAANLHQASWNPKVHVKTMGTKRPVPFF